MTTENENTTDSVGVEEAPNTIGQKIKKNWGKLLIVAILGLYAADFMSKDTAVPQAELEKTVYYVNFLGTGDKNCQDDDKPSIAKAICKDAELAKTISEHNVRETDQFSAYVNTHPEIANYINDERTVRVEKLTACLGRRGFHSACVGGVYKKVDTEAGVNSVIAQIKERQANSVEGRFERVLQEMAGRGGQCGYAANFLRQTANTFGIASPQTNNAFAQAASRGC